MTKEKEIENEIKEYEKCIKLAKKGKSQYYKSYIPQYENQIKYLKRKLK